MVDQTFAQEISLAQSWCAFIVFSVVSVTVVNMGRNTFIPRLSYLDQAEVLVKLSMLVIMLMVVFMLVSKCICITVAKHTKFIWPRTGVDMLTFTFMAWVVLTWWVTYRVMNALILSHVDIWGRTVHEMKLPLTGKVSDPEFTPLNSNTLVFYFSALTFTACTLYIVLRYLTNDITELF